MKKILCLILTVALLIGCVPALAADGLKEVVCEEMKFTTKIAADQEAGPVGLVRKKRSAAGRGLAPAGKAFRFEFHQNGIERILRPERGHIRPLDRIADPIHRDLFNFYFGMTSFFP